VDGFHVASAGALMVGEVGFKACTPYGCMKMLESIGMKDLRGKHAVVIGRSNIVGKPMAMMLLQANATVTITHSGTADLGAMTRQADIVVAAVGKRNVLTADMVKPGAVVIDVGMNRDDEGKLCGDVDFAGCKEVAGYITPVPGGVGPMTITMLLGQHHGSGRAHRRPGLMGPGLTPAPRRPCVSAVTPHLLHTTFLRFLNPHEPPTHCLTPPACPCLIRSSPNT
jgi:5,10-methylene-tetrahydrofolate dehydrogenase/methenyl tetrahydrofolate cyclohydrolase